MRKRLRSPEQVLDERSGGEALADWPLFRSLDSAARTALQTRLVARRFSKGSWLLEAGQRAVELHFVVKGLVREYYVSAEGKEHTRSFVAERGVTGSMLDLRSGALAVTFIQALEAVETQSMPVADFDALAERHVSLLRLAQRHAEALAVFKTKREHEMLALSAGERLTRWLTENATLDARITRRLLASYLGITPQHLSRLSQGNRSRKGRTAD